MNHFDQNNPNLQEEFPQEVANIHNIIEALKHQLSSQQQEGPLLTISQEKYRELSIQSLSKIGFYLVQLTQMCFPHFKSTHPHIYQQLLTDNEDNNLKIKALVSKFYNSKSMTGQLRREMEQLKIRVPKAPVSAYYLFYLHKCKDIRVDSAEGVPVVWSSLSEEQKQPYHLLAEQIGIQFNENIKKERQQGKKSRKRRNKKQRLEQIKNDVGKEVKEESSQSEASCEDVLSNSQPQLDEYTQEGKQMDHNSPTQAREGSRSLSPEEQTPKQSPSLMARTISTAFN